MGGIKTPAGYKEKVKEAVAVLKEANKEGRIEFYMKKFGISRGGAILKIKEIDAQKAKDKKAKKAKK